MVDLPSSPLAAVDRGFEAIALETARLTYALSGTSVREKLLQNLADDVCRGQLGLAFRMHLTAAKMHGLETADILALIRFVAPYAGHPAATDALGRLGEVGPELGMDRTVAPLAAGAAKADDDRPGRVDPAMTSSDVWMSTFLRLRTARAWSEEQLTLREQAIIALTTDISLGVRGEPFRRHVQLLLECGASAEEVRDVVRFVAELGLSRAAAAMAELEPVLRAHEARLGDG